MYLCAYCQVILLKLWNLYPIAKEDPLLQHIDDNLELVRDGEMTWEVFVDKTAIDLNRLERLYENE